MSSSELAAGSEPTIDDVESSTSAKSLTTVATKPGRFRPDIEGFRALAIISVLIFHAHDFITPGQPGWFNTTIDRVLSAVPGGFLGVDVFFVISGFLITGLLVREGETTGRINFGKFYARRVRRILPAATVTLLVTLIASMVILPVQRAASTATDVLWAAVFNSDIHFSRSGVDYMSVAIDPSPVLHFWSLNDEEKFYVVWPVLLVLALFVAKRSIAKGFVAARLGVERIRTVLFAVLLVLVISSLSWSQYLVANSDNSGYFSATSRAFELGIGGLLAIAFPAVERLSPATRNGGALFGVLLVCWCMATFSTLTPFPGVDAMPVLIGSALVLAGTEAGVVGRFFSHRVPRMFGRISYSLYLWHWPIFVLAAALTFSGTLSTSATLGLLGFAVLVSWLSQKWIESPLQHGPLLKSTGRALGAGLALIALTVLASLVAQHMATAEQVSQNVVATQGLHAVARPSSDLLYIGDSITTRGIEPLQAALRAAGWNATIDALGGRPITAGVRRNWTPLCVKKSACGADLVLAAHTPPHTIVISVGTNAFNLVYDRVSAPTATSSGLLARRDGSGHYIVAGQDSPADFASAVEKVMSMVPSTTQVYWVGIWLDDRNWKSVTWRAANTAMATAAGHHINAHYLDYAQYVVADQVPYEVDGSHPTPKGMGMRARWIVSNLR